MADLGENFDPDEIPPGTDFGTIPPGWYVAQIIDSEKKDASTGGKILVLTWEIIDGEFEKRRIWDNQNWEHAKADTMLMARQHVAKICKAVGIGPINNSTELHHKPCRIQLGIQKGNARLGGGTYDDKNNVKGFAPLTAAAPAGKPATAPAARPAAAATAAPKPAATSAAKPAAGPTGSRPWAKTA